MFSPGGFHVAEGEQANIRFIKGVMFRHPGIQVLKIQTVCREDAQYDRGADESGGVDIPV